VTEALAPQFSAADPIDGGELRLPRPPGVIRRFWARHPVAADSILAAVVGLAAASDAMDTGLRRGAVSWLTVIAIALVGISVIGIYVRRTQPLLTSAIGSAPIVTLLWTPSDQVLLPTVVAVYAVAAHRSARSGAVAAAAVWASATITVTLGEVWLGPLLTTYGFGTYGATDRPVWAAVLAFSIPLAVLLALALAIGINIGNRRRYIAAVIERARQLAVERDQQGQLAAAAERARIAREMHDIVSHSLTVMVALAEGSAIAAAQDAPQAASAMRAVADTGRTAMVDMRRMLGVLGGGTDADTAPQPGLADLPLLISRFRALKVPVAFRTEGTVPSDPAVQLTVFRLVQESLTNALRYANAPTEVLVSVAQHDGGLVVTVTDDGVGGPASRAKPAGSGRGLIGLHERVASVGGTLTAGPRADGHGWRVQAVLAFDDEKPDDDKPHDEKPGDELLDRKGNAS
jgi:signal transduction histidine kinase